MVRSSTVVILFDIDGTLIDHDAAEVIAVVALRGRIEHTDDATGFLRRWRSAFERHYNRYLAGELSIQQQRRERFREVFDLNLSDAAADRLSALYIDEYLAACELYPDVKPVLAQLASYPMGIISNGERSQQQHKLLKTSIDHYFGQLILSGDCGVAKPALRIFELACHSMGVSPSQAVYVGDRRDIDAETARSAGMQWHMVRSFWSVRSQSLLDANRFPFRATRRHNADRTRLTSRTRINGSLRNRSPRLYANHFVRRRSPYNLLCCVVAHLAGSLRPDWLLDHAPS